MGQTTSAETFEENENNVSFSRNIATISNPHRRYDMGQTIFTENSRKMTFDDITESNPPHRRYNMRQTENSRKMTFDDIAAISNPWESENAAPIPHRRYNMVQTENSRKMAFGENENTATFFHNAAVISTTPREEEYTDFYPYLSNNISEKMKAIRENEYTDSFPQLSSAKKTISGEKEYADSFPQLSSAKKTISGEKNTTPLPNRSYNSVAKSGMNVVYAPVKKENTQNKTSGKKTIPLRKEYDSQPVHYYEKAKYVLIEIPTELVRYLATNDCKVYGYWYCWPWQCQHDPNCENKFQCEYAEECHDRRKQYTRESLENYLKNPDKCNIFENPCIKCNKKSLIKSFLLYTQSNVNLVEIICHLEWNNNYRVFGSWKCSHCQKEWKSAYTWVSLQKFIEQIPGAHLNQGEFLMQNCKKCKNCKKCNNDKNIILGYEPLVQSDGPPKHKMELCAKCMYYGVECTQLDDYFGNKKPNFGILK